MQQHTKNTENQARTGAIYSTEGPIMHKDAFRGF